VLANTGRLPADMTWQFTTELCTYVTRYAQVARAYLGYLSSTLFIIYMDSCCISAPVFRILSLHSTSREWEFPGVSEIPHVNIEEKESVYSLYSYAYVIETQMSKPSLFILTNNNHPVLVCIKKQICLFSQSALVINRN